MPKKKQVITGYIVNGVSYPCKSTGIPITHSTRKRAPQRQLNGLTEKEIEDNFLNVVRKSFFNEEKSIPYAWLCKLFDTTNIKFMTSSSIVRFFGFLLNETVPREVYRRRPCSFFWMCQKGREICNFLQENVVQIIIDGETITLSPELLQRHISKPLPSSKSVLPSLNTNILLEDSFPLLLTTSELNTTNFFPNYNGIENLEPYDSL